MKLDQLPEELYGAILETIGDLEQRKRSTVALSQALPRSPVPWRWIYHSICLISREGTLLLYKHLRRCGGMSSTQAQWVQIFSSEVWETDAQILADLVGILPNLQKISLCVGTTFAPEHLDDMFESPRPDLLSLDITFRPYVQKATYYQFLKGSYFDSLLIHLSNWPASSNLRHLSIVQTLPPSPTLFQSFAQPIVFFSLEPISHLIHAPSLANTTHLRIQIPARPIAQFLSVASPSPSPSPTPSIVNTPVPSLTAESALSQPLGKALFLDLSTTYISAGHVPALLARFPVLTHLLLDGTGILPRSTEITGEFAELGRLLATAGMRRVRERDKAIRGLVVAMRAAKEAYAVTSVKDTVSSSVQSGALTSKAKKGRRGVATAKFSLREKPVTTTIPVVIADAGPPTISISTLEKIRILPPLTKLQSLCLTTFAVPTPNLVREWDEDFARGWREGVAVLAGARRRLETGVRMKLTNAWKFDDEGGYHVGRVGELNGLVELSEGDWATEMEQADMLGLIPPKLCFAGRLDGAEGVAHAEGCAHAVSWDC